MTDTGRVSISNLAPTLRVDDAPVPELNSSFLSMRVDERLNRPARCVLRFTNWGMVDGAPDYLFFDSPHLQFGRQIAIDLGVEQENIFRGQINALLADNPSDRPPEIAIEAEDRLQHLQYSKRTRRFNQMRLADIFIQTGAEYNFAVEFESATSSPIFTSTLQFNESDLSYLVRLADEFGYLFYYRGNKLVVKPVDHLGPAIELAYGQHLSSFQARADLSGQLTDFLVSGWNPANGSAVLGAASRGGLRDKFPGDRNGGRLFFDTYGKRLEQVAHLSLDSASEADALADEAYLQRALRFITGTGTTTGSPILRCGERVAISGLGERFSGDYLITQVHHLYDQARGYRCEFDVILATKRQRTSRPLKSIPKGKPLPKRYDNNRS